MHRMIAPAPSLAPPNPSHPTSTAPAPAKVTIAMKPTSIPRVSLTKSVLTRFSTLIHPPLTLSPADSRKFLSLIKDSFRTSLAASTPAVEPTDHHLNRILAADTFAGNPTSKESRINRFLQDPLALFDEQCLAGKADADLAALCLSKHLRLVREKPKLEYALKDLQWSAVSTVLSGLQKAGVGPASQVLQNQSLAKAVAEGLAAEGKENVIVRWSKATREEATLSVRQNIVYYGLKSVVELHGWEKAMKVFRDVLAGAGRRERYSKGQFSMTGLMLCEEGMKKGFGDTPAYRGLVQKAEVWGTHWQMQAWVCLKFAKVVKVGVGYFQYFNDSNDEGRGLRNRSWFRQDMEFPLNLVKECLAQGMLKEAEMIKDVVETKFAGRVTNKILSEMKEEIEAGRAGGIAHKTEEGNSEQGHDLQGILNTLG